MHTVASRLAIVLTLAATAWPSPAPVYASAHTAFAFALAPAQASDDAIRQAEALYKEGKAKFETAEYQEALALWKQAYEMLPDGPDTRVIRHALVYNISEAEVQAYEVTHNIAHLRKAKILLQDYLTEHEALHGTGDEAVKERAGARTRLQEVSDKLAAAEARGETARPIDEADESGAVATTEASSEPTLTPAQQEKQRIRAERQAAAEAKRARIQQIRTDPELSRQDRRYKRMVIGGSVGLGVGTAFGIVAALSGSVAAADIYGDFPAALPIALTSAGIFVGGVVTGSIFLTKGLRGRKHLRRVPATTALLVPILTTESAGLSFVGRF